MLNLSKVNVVVNRQALVNIVQVIDKSNTGKDGCEPISFEWNLKMLFLQHAFNLSGDELENQFADRLIFQKFVGISFDREMPDCLTLWNFKEALIEQR